MAEPMHNDDVGGGGLGSREYMIGAPGIRYRDEQATSLRIQQLGAVPGTILVILGQFWVILNPF